MPSRLALGTVQFGLAYGITNKTGVVSAEQITDILAAGRRAGMDTLDTAIAYGKSEERLGEAGVQGWRVVSKIGEPAADEPDIEAWMHEQVLGSLRRLKIARLAGLLLHRPAALHGARGRALYEALHAVRRSALVEKIGVSIYDPEELDQLGAYSFDLVQAPFNVLDRRLATSGWLHRLKAAGTEVHTRSVFLQGLLLLRAHELPEAFARWQPLWRDWNSWLEDNGYSAVQACLGFVSAQPDVDRIIVGVENVGQLLEVVSATQITINELPTGLASADLELISPVRWRSQ